MLVADKVLDGSSEWAETFQSHSYNPNNVPVGFTVTDRGKSDEKGNGRHALSEIRNDGRPVFYYSYRKSRTTVYVSCPHVHFHKAQTP
jgi:hypothetical protein